MESQAAMETRKPLGPLIPSHQNNVSEALDFSKLTPCQFGITPESFTAFPKDKDKSRVAQLKARRRSTIGLRGSPETNSLICFRAKQLMKTPPRTPQHLLESPLFSGRDTIKQKMAAFQRMMCADEENTERSDSLMEGEGQRRAQSDVERGSEERENLLAPVTPPLSKRHRRGTPHRGGLWEEQIDEEPLSELTHTQTREPQVEFKSPKMAPSLLMSLPMLSKPELIKTGDVEVSSTKKRVRFGVPLSPEFFDKTLPPSTPLQKGGTPAPPPSSTGRKNSLLKTPQRFELPLPQPNFSSPEGGGGSPVLTTHTYSLGGEVGEVVSDDVFLDNLKISFPIMDEEYDNPPLDRKELQPEVQHQTVECAEAPRPCGRKRKQPAESVMSETRRSSRSAAESAKGKIKTSVGKNRFGTKDVDRSLYGKRDYASKNPLLSPIMESAISSLSSTPKVPPTGETPDSGPAPAHSTNHSQTQSYDTTASLVAAAALWRHRFLLQAKDSVLDTNLTAGSEHSVLTDAPVQSQASEESSVTSGYRRARAGGAAKGRRNSASRNCSRTKAKDEQEVSKQEPEVPQPNQQENPAGEQSSSESTERKSEVNTPSGGRWRGQKSARTEHGSVEEEEERLEEQQGLKKMCEYMLESAGTLKEEDMKQTSEEKNNKDSKPSTLMENLEPWQQPNFCIEDVLKPVVKSRGSVRRSLRHRQSVDVPDKGLAWVEHTSPMMITNQRRRTRSRLSGVSQPPASEETLI